MRFGCNNLRSQKRIEIEFDSYMMAYEEHMHVRVHDYRNRGFLFRIECVITLQPS